MYVLHDQYALNLHPVTFTDFSQNQAAEEKYVIPETREYVAASGKGVIMVLRSAAELVPVPLLKDALGLAIKIIEVCEVSTSIVYGRKRPEGAYFG